MFGASLAAWLVVLHHYMQVAYNFQLTDPISVALHRYGAIGVDLFFVISGFVIYLSSTGRKITPLMFSAHRLARVAPAYWIFTLATAATIAFVPGMVPYTLFEPMFLLKSLLFIPTQNPTGIGFFPMMTVGWTLNYEMAFYAVFLISLFSPQNLRLPALVVGIGLLYWLAPSLGGALEFYGNPIIFEFLLGVAIAWVYQRGWVGNIKPAIAWVATGCALGLIIYNGQVTHHPIKSGIPCAILVLCALSQERAFPKSSLLTRLGDWSYSTYLCHILIICAMVKAGSIFHLDPTVTLTGAILGIFIVSAFSFHVIEKPISSLVRNTRSINAKTYPQKEGVR
ncbi:acyltransferase [Pseudomonas sp. TNT2022 ID1025]|uniref:Acyltransferase n=1 Tax=Pseudomonas rubra TaxID=2942627 RepID=A0ABT5PGD7_9PSED|nr:acyltransferase [Pseudomonas rubra]MDD1017375.1 acyltransferase [Pseudomonas rubra]MDD1041687.1 acyltransferase [Pseudomonas rubra]MDD1158090.1 acyltransferase [Pseudomonas rubra]